MTDKYCKDMEDVDEECPSVNKCHEVVLGTSKCSGGGGYFVYSASKKKCGCCTQQSNVFTRTKSKNGYNMYLKKVEGT